MQEEVQKHTKKIYKEVKNPNHNFAEKLKEIFIEIFIIVFAVTLSIWLHSWSEHNHQQKEVNEFLVDTKVDLISDLEAIKQTRNQITNSVEKFNFLIKLNNNSIDSLLKKNQKITLELQPIIRITNNGNYEGFKSSGKIAYIEKKQLKLKILKYYQELMPSIEKIEDIYNKKMEKIGELSSNKSGTKDLYLNKEFKAYLDFIIQYGNNTINSYDNAINNTNDLINEIDKAKKN